MLGRFFLFFLLPAQIIFICSTILAINCRREGAPEIRTEMSSSSKKEDGVDSGLVTRPGQILPNGLIALNYSGVEPIDKQTEAVFNGKDGIIRSDGMVMKPEVSSAAAMPCGTRAMPPGISEMAMMQAFQQFQAGMMPYQQHQAQIASTTRNSTDVKPPPVLHAPASALNMQQNTNVAPQMNNSAATAIQNRSPVNYLGQAAIPSTNAHTAASMMNNSAAAATAPPPTSIADEIQIEHNIHDPAVTYQTQQGTNASEAAAKSEPKQTQSELEALTYDQIAKSHPTPSDAGQFYGFTVEPQQASASRVSGLGGPSHAAPQAQLDPSEYTLALEIAARERAMMFYQQSALAEARMQTLMRMSNLQQQVLPWPGLGNNLSASASGDVAQRILEQQAFHRLGLNAAGPTGFTAEGEQNLVRQQLRQQILPQEDRNLLQLQAALDRQDKERILRQQQGLQRSEMTASVARATASGRQENQYERSQEGTLGIDPVAAALRELEQGLSQQQDPITNNSVAASLRAKEQAFLQRNLMLLRGQRDASVANGHQHPSRQSSEGLGKQPALELQDTLRPTDFDRLHTFSSLDDVLRLREVSPQYEALLKARQERGDILSTVRGFSSLSQDDLLRLREAFLDREGSRQISNESRNIQRMKMAELWDKQTRELAEVTDEVANEAREAIRQHQQRKDLNQDSLERQSTLDCLAEAAEMAGRGIESDLSPQSNDMDAKKKSWEKMKKASKKATLKLGKATSRLMDSDSETASFVKSKTNRDDIVPILETKPEDAAKATQEAPGDKCDTEHSVSTKKRKLHLTAQNKDDKAKKKCTNQHPSLATAHPQTSASPITLSTELAQFKKLKTSSIFNQVESMFPKSQPHSSQSLRTGQVGPTEAAFQQDHSVPPSEVSYKKRIVAEEGQFDDPEDEE